MLQTQVIMMNNKTIIVSVFTVIGILVVSTVVPYLLFTGMWSGASVSDVAGDMADRYEAGFNTQEYPRISASVTLQELNCSDGKCSVTVRVDSMNADCVGLVRPENSTSSQGYCEGEQLTTEEGEVLRITGVEQGETIVVVGTIEGRTSVIRIIETN